MGTESDRADNQHHSPSKRAGSIRKRLPSSTSSPRQPQASPPKSPPVDIGVKTPNQYPPDRPIHQAQDSLFSSSSGWTNYRGFLNLSILLLVVSNGRVALENIIKYGILISPFEWLSYALHDPWRWPNFTMVVLSNIFVFVTFFFERKLESGTFSNRFAAWFYSILFTLHLGAPVVVTLHVQGNPFFAAGMMSLYVVEFLKLFSYAHVNYWCRCARIAAAENQTKSPVNLATKKDDRYTYPNNLTLSNLYYFMFAPTLCYELKFPRSPGIRKTFVIKRLCELVGLSFVVGALSQQWIVPLLKNSMQPFSDMNLGHCIERVLKLAIPNHLIWLLFFYVVFHSALNLIAEILRFADREFYRDFWNAETISYFWKTWNIPVHRWALRHIYKPMMRNKWSKLQASIAVFFVSAFFHEYLVSIPLSMFRLWAYYGMMMQVPLSILTDIMGGGRAGNIIVWLSLILVQPMAILMYVHDWYVLHYT
uniref:O-acyltransferase n=1 Tax=Plectus sambesii TaxID=2011161 RepID=A0A914W462_9BILA